MLVWGAPRVQSQPQELRQKDGGASRLRLRRHHRAPRQHQPRARRPDAEGGRSGDDCGLSRGRQHQPEVQFCLGLGLNLSLAACRVKYKLFLFLYLLGL